MQCNITIRKKDKGFQCIVSYKDGNRWRQKSKQGFETQKAAKIHAQTIIDELKKTITFSIDDSLKDLTLMQFFNIYLNEQLNLTANTLIAYKNALKNRVLRIYLTILYYSLYGIFYPRFYIL